MISLERQRVCIFVDRSTRTWVVRDPDGNLWSVPPTDAAWDHREPYTLNDDSPLELVPGHYRYMLKLPF